MAFPYFISNTVLLVVVGLVLSAVPYFFSWFDKGYEPRFKRS
jgi:hypothetical protein